MAAPLPRVPALPPEVERFAMIVGHGAVGLSVFALLAAGPRVLGPTGYTALALTWTLVTIISVGLVMPGEQVITRNVSAGSSAAALKAVARRMLWLAPIAALLLPFALDDGVAGGDIALWLATILVAAVAYVFLSIARGELAGCGAFGAYSLVLFAEMAGRLLLIGTALVIPSQGALLLAAAVAMPIVLAAVLARGWANRLPLGDATGLAVDTRLEHLSFTAVAAMMQIVLSTAQFWLYRQSPEVALAGAFVTAVSYMRIPLVLAGGIYAPLLNGAAAAFVARDRDGVIRKTGEALIIGVGGAAVVSGALAAFSEVGMAVLYGPDSGLPMATYVWLAASTVVTVAASVLTNVLFACARAPATALLWLPATVLTTVLYANAGGSPTALAAGATIGLAFAAICLAAFLVLRGLPARQPAG